MQGISFSPYDQQLILDFNPYRHACLSHAQQAILDAVTLLATGDVQAIYSGVSGGELAGCKVRRISEAEAAEDAKKHAAYFLRKTGNHYKHERTHRWRAEWAPVYDDRDVDHYMDVYATCAVVLDCSRTNRKGKTRRARAEVIYDDPRDAELLLALVSGEVSASDPIERDQLAPDAMEWTDELPPVDAYAA